VNPQKLFEKVLEWLVNELGQEEIRKLRQQFFSGISDLQEEQASYEPLLNCFLEWLVYERPFGERRGALAAYYERAAADEEKPLLTQMAANLHSLFLVRKVEQEAAHLEELFLAERIAVSERRSLAGLQRGQVLEARLLPLGDRWIFSGAAFVVHPQPAEKIIRQAIAQSRIRGEPSPGEIIRAFRELNFRYLERFHQRVALEKVYAEWPALIASPRP